MKGGGGERDRKWDPPHQNTVKPHRESDDPRKNRSPSPSLLPLPPPRLSRGEGSNKAPPPKKKKEIHNKAEVCLAASSAVSPSHSCIGEGETPPPAVHASMSLGGL